MWSNPDPADKLEAFSSRVYHNRRLWIWLAEKAFTENKRFFINTGRKKDGLMY